MTQAQYKHEWFGLDTSKGQGSISGKAIDERFKALIDSDITLHIQADGGNHMTVPVQILCWRIKVTVHGHGVVQWQFEPKHGEGTVWVESTSGKYSVIS